MNHQMEQHNRVLVEKLAAANERIDALEAALRLLAHCPDCDGILECHPRCDLLRKVGGSFRFSVEIARGALNDE